MGRRLIVGITGATGAVYGIALLKALRKEKGWKATWS
jgi:3-polyprenyl-4-hydroxybenzoate decarboxylase